MQVAIGNNIVVQNPTDELVKWCKQNLIIDNPEYVKKVRMGFWVGNTPKKLTLYETHGDTIILPYGTLKQIQHIIKGTPVDSKFMPYQTIDYGEPISLYPYQEKAVKMIKNGLFGILQSPCGSGKTRCGLALIKEYKRPALWLCHTKDLLNQSKKAAKEFFDEDLFGTITEGKVNIGKGITFATVQTMCKLDLLQYRDIWDLVIVDEAHNISGSPTSVSMYYKVLNCLSARHKYGLSATVHRSDGFIKSTFALIGDVIYTVPDEDIADKIMRVCINPVGTGVKVNRQCCNTDGTLNYTKMITSLCNNPDRNELIRDCIIDNVNHSCLILSDRLEHLETLKDMLPDDMKPYAVMISGKMTTKKGKQEREQAIEDMKSGNKRYLFATYSLCKEGLDIPRLDRLFLTLPHKDYAVITQSIGRIARIYENKDEPVVYDFVDDIGMLIKSYKKRCAVYRKNNCYFTEE